MSRITMVVYEVYARDARVRRHCRALAAAGHEVEVLGVDGQTSADAAAQDGISFTPLVAAKYRGNRRLAYVAAYAQFALRALFAIAARSGRRSPDVVYVNNPPDALVFAAWPARLRGARVILDVHDMTSELYAAKFGGRSGVVPRLIRLVEGLSYRSANAIVTVVDAYRTRIQGIVGRSIPVVTVWNVPDTGWARSSAMKSPREREAGEPLRLGHHGTIVERFGVDRAVEAVSILRQRGVPVTLEILGDGDFADAVQRLIEVKQLQAAVRFDRRTFDHADLSEFADRIDLGIAPYRLSEFTAHSLPTKLLEYLALGVPTVVTETEMVRKYLAPGVRTVATGSAAELVEAVLELADPDRRNALRSEGLRLAGRYSWEQQREDLLKIVGKPRERDYQRPP